MARVALLLTTYLGRVLQLLCARLATSLATSSSRTRSPAWQV